ncbi:peptidoglycan-binding protein [Streptomyces sp. NPDC057271]|uniref:peptidoglycan-binding domain-containing protein n=1 Tax=unclassified Streptomyces TaxID=2593676 RepID=UPI0036354F2C
MPLFLGGIATEAEAYDIEYDPEWGPHEPERPATRRRGALVALAAAVAVAVVATAAVAGGLLGDGNEPDDRAAAPTLTASASENVAVSEAPSSSASTPSSSASATASASRSASPSSSSPSPSPSTRTAEVSATTSAKPPSPTATRTTSAPSRTPTVAPVAPAPTLRYGDTGAEVAELQRRLEQAWFYDGPIDGEYSRQVRRAVERYQSYQDIEEDGEGVYGPETRRVLEAETSG